MEGRDLLAFNWNWYCGKIHCFGTWVRMYTCSVLSEQKRGDKQNLFLMYLALKAYLADEMQLWVKSWLFHYQFNEDSGYCQGSDQHLQDEKYISDLSLLNSFSQAIYKRLRSPCEAAPARNICTMQRSMTIFNKIIICCIIIVADASGSSSIYMRDVFHRELVNLLRVLQGLWHLAWG